MHDEAFREQLAVTPVVAILRGLQPEHLLPTIDALAQGGITLLEIALRRPEDTALIEQATRAFPHLHIGAGTVTSAELAERAVASGAAFLLTPHVAEDAILAAARLGVPVIPGAFTPTEIQRCLTLGCAAVKLFPAHVGGPATVRALRSPYPDLPLIAVGGVTPDNLRDYLSAGAIGVGLGSELVRVGPGTPDFAAITNRARRCLAPSQ